MSVQVLVAPYTDSGVPSLSVDLDLLRGPPCVLGVSSPVPVGVVEVVKTHLSTGGSWWFLHFDSPSPVSDTR